MIIKEIIILSITVILFSNSAFAVQNEIKSINKQKIQEDKITRYIVHAFWYPKETLKNKKVRNDTIPEDINKFKNILKTIVKPEYLPDDNVIDANIMAVENLWESNDYILMEYEKNNYKIQIHDGKAFYIGVFSNKEPNDLSEVGNYAKSLALEILNIPKMDIMGGEIYSGVYNKDIGESKCGAIGYPNNAPYPEFWYSVINWWSDSRNTLFLIGKGVLNGIDYKTQAGPPSVVVNPRKFKKNNVK